MLWNLPLLDPMTKSFFSRDKERTITMRTPESAHSSILLFLQFKLSSPDHDHLHIAPESVNGNWLSRSFCPRSLIEDTGRIHRSASLSFRSGYVHPRWLSVREKTQYVCTRYWILWVLLVFSQSKRLFEGLILSQTFTYGSIREHLYFSSPTPRPPHANTSFNESNYPRLGDLLLAIQRLVQVFGTALIMPTGRHGYEVTP